MYASDFFQGALEDLDYVIVKILYSFVSSFHWAAEFRLVASLVRYSDDEYKITNFVVIFDLSIILFFVVYAACS